MAREVKRVNIDMPIETLKRLDDYAESMTISRSAAMLVLINMGLDSRKAMSDFSEFVKLAQAENEKK